MGKSSSGVVPGVLFPFHNKKLYYRPCFMQYFKLLQALNCIFALRVSKRLDSGENGIITIVITIVGQCFLSDLYTKTTS